MIQKTTRRHRRHARIRARVRGTADRPRVSVFRSLKGITLQLIDDEQGRTLLAVYGRPEPGVTKTVQAQHVGAAAAEQAKAKGIARVAFDRSGWAYQGRIKALAEALRAGGLEF